MPLNEALATPENKARYVRRLFATIATRYDLITVLLSYGQDRRWKDDVRQLATRRPDVRVLDLACGTGDIAFAVARDAGSVVGLDITHEMIRLASSKSGGQGSVRFLVGDMMALPFVTSAFDVVTVGYGLRNVPIVETSLAEIYRVLKPRGQLISLDFNRPQGKLLRAIYFGYLTIVGSLVGFVLHGDPDTYRYIPESIRRYPGAEGMASRMKGLGFVDVRWHPRLGGLMAIHVASRP